MMGGEVLGLVEELLVALEDAGITGGLLHEHAIAVAVQVHQALHSLGGFKAADHIRVLVHLLIPSFQFFICKFVMIISDCRQRSARSAPFRPRPGS